MAGVTTVVTDSRVLFDAFKLWGNSRTTIHFDDISSVNVSYGVIQKRLNLETNSRVYGLGVGQIERDELEDMAEFIRYKMKETKADYSSKAGQDSVSQEKDPLDKIERLGGLRDDGIITEEEFQEKKESLLDQV